jgi:PGF-pre-PGF domain-containing protein
MQKKLVSLVFLVILLSSSVLALAGSSSSSTGSGSGVGVINADKYLKKIFFTDVVEYAAFELSETVYSFMPSISVYDSTPEEVVGFGGETYKYFKIDWQVEDSVVRAAEIKFAVPKEWSEENEVSLFRYYEDVWSSEGIDVEFFGESSDVSYYVADVPGFGYFVIGRGEIFEDLLEEIEELEIEDLDDEVIEFDLEFEDEEMERSYSWMWTLLIIVIIYFLYLRLRRKA